MMHQTHETIERVLMLGLGGEYFALDATMVREIMDPVAMTRVPGARDFVQGVINVRGNIVPLADLRLRFGMQATQATPDTRVVVLEVESEGDADPLLVGIVADKVYEVSEISPPAAGTVPRIGMSWPADLVRGVATWKGDFVIVPDLSTILS